MSSSKHTQFELLKMILILSSIAIVIEYAETMLLPAIPDIIKEFNSTYSSSSWILSGYLITAAVMAPLVGKLSDTYGKKKVLISIMSIFTASIALAGFSSNMTILIAVRVVQGIGLSMFIIALSILQSSVPKEKYALANGILASTYFSGSSIGILLGGSIIHYFGWRTIFFSLIPVVITLLVVVLRVLNVRENEELKQHVDVEVDGEEKRGKQGFSLSAKNNMHEKEEVEKAASSITSNSKANNNNYFVHSPNVKKNTFLKSLDIRGAIIFLIAITSFLAALTYMENGNSSVSSGNTTVDTSSNANHHGYDSSGRSILIPTLLSVSIICFILFIITEKKRTITTTAPLIDFRLITNKTILPVLVMFLILGFTMFMVYQTVPILARAPIPLGLGGNAIASSFILIPFTLVFLILSPIVGIMVRKFGNMILFVAGSVISTIGYFSIFLFHSSQLEVSASLAIVSTGLALLNTIGMNIVMLSTPKQFGGVTIAMVQVLTFIGMSIGPVVGAMYMQNYQVHTDGISNTSSASYPSPEAYYLIFLTAAIASLFFVALAIILKRQNSQAISESTINHQK